MSAGKTTDYHADEIQQEYLEEVVALYTKTGSIRAAARELEISPMKVRKALITYGIYRNEVSDNIWLEYQARLHAGVNSRDAVQEIADDLHMTVSNVYAYLPYSTIVYNAEEKSDTAQRQESYRNRKKNGQTGPEQEIMSEDRVRQLVKEYLLSEEHGNWQEDKVQEASLHQHGVDLLMKGGSHGGERFVIECKGKSYAKSARSVNRESWLNALGQLITRMDSKRVITSGKTKGSISRAYKYGLGLYWVGAQTALRRIPHEIAKVLNLYIFSVDDEGFVKKWTPSMIGKEYAEEEFHRPEGEQDRVE